MSKQIAAGNFLLPLYSPHYGPGGIPFAYPPLGLYLFSVFIKLTGKYYIYLIWMPPIYTLISLIPLYYLSYELFKSPYAGAFTVVIAATSSDLYIAHAWAAGIARAPAFIFALFSIYFFHRHFNSPSKNNIVLTGLFFGLALLSHLAYGLFCFVWIVCWTLLKPSLRRIIDSTISICLGLLIALIWIIPISSRFGGAIFLNAFNSHSSGDSASFLATGLSAWGRLIVQNTLPIRSNLLMMVLIGIGAFFLIKKKEFTLLLFYLLVILFFPENARFVFLIGSLIAGFGLSTVIEQLLEIFPKEKNLLAQSLSIGLVLFIIGFLWYNGCRSLNNQSPIIENATFELAENIQTILPLDSKYLALIKQDEAEWLPFLFQRDPIVSQWGSEWLGAYDEQTYLMSLFRDCQERQDWPCVENVIGETGTQPDFLITYSKDKKLNDQLSALPQWESIYKNERYTVWVRVN